MIVTDYRTTVEDVYGISLPEDIAVRGIDIRQIYLELAAGAGPFFVEFLTAYGHGQRYDLALHGNEWRSNQLPFATTHTGASLIDASTVPFRPVTLGVDPVRHIKYRVRAIDGSNLDFQKFMITFTIV